jgi:F-type H+-transporting ATPase subunit delta
MSTGAVAERYAQALFELGVESGTLSALADKLSDFALTYGSSRELRGALNNPVLSNEQRKALVSEVARKLGVPEIGIKGLLFMSQRGRLPALGATVQRLTELADEKNGILRASVTTATSMPESYYQSLSSQLSAATQKKIVLERSVDDDLVGGAIARVGDMLIDGSVRGKLQKLERDLLSAVAAGAS